MTPEIIRAPAYAVSPLDMARTYWPSVGFYDRELEIIQSVEDTPETVVTAGNKLGKDFTTAFIVLCWFIRYGRFGCRIVTTSVKDDHLRVLWGEIGWFLANSVVPLTSDKPGGFLKVNHRDIKFLVDGRREHPISYLRGMVTERGEGLAGHHAPYTLAVGDEASGLDDAVQEQVQGWAKRMLWIGNPNACTTFFYRMVKQGDILA